MTFLNPTLAAAGLLCVMVPIIIHVLMRRRRKPVQWAAMRFVVEAYRRQRRRMNLEQLLLLAARCLMVLLLAMAVGRPVLGAAGLLGNRPARTLYLIIDNSLVSGVVAAPGAESEFEANRKVAIEAIDALDASRGDRVSIITAGWPAEAIVLQPTPELTVARQMIRDLQPVHARADWAAAARVVHDQVGRESKHGGDCVVTLISHWREGAVDLEAVMPSAAAGADIRWLVTAPSQTKADNVAILSVEPARAVMMAANTQGIGAEVGGLSVRVRLARSGTDRTDAASTLLRVGLVSSDGEVLTSDDQSKQIITWSPGQQLAEAFVTVAAPNADRRGLGDRMPIFVVASIDEDSIGPDNKAASVVQVRDRLDVAMISPPGSGALGGESLGSLATYSAPDWMAMALSPRGDFTLRQRQAGELRVQVVDPQQGIAPTIAAGGAGRGAGALSGMDAVIVPRPSLLDAAAWRAVRESLDAGACIVICPDAKSQTQVWTEQVKVTLGIDWNIGRDSISFASPTLVRANQAATPSKRAGALLSMIEAELPELVRSVTVSRVLPVQAGADGFDVLLSLEDGSPWVVASTPDSSAVERAGTRRGTVVLFTSSLDTEWTDLPARPLMVPLLQEVVRQGISRGVGVAVVKAGESPAAFAAGAVDLKSVPQVHGNDASEERVVGLDARGRVRTPLRTRGAWTVRSDSGLLLAALAVNADAEASSVAVRSREQIAAWLQPCASRVSWIEWNAAPSPRGLSPVGETSMLAKVEAGSASPPVVSLPLLIAAACIGLLELLAARWFSHAHQSSFARGGNSTEGSRA